MNIVNLVEKQQKEIEIKTEKINNQKQEITILNKKQKDFKKLEKELQKEKEHNRIYIKWTEEFIEFTRNEINLLQKEKQKYKNMYEAEHRIHEVRNEQLARKEKTVQKVLYLENKIKELENNILTAYNYIEYYLLDNMKYEDSQEALKKVQNILRKEVLRKEEYDGHK